MAASLELNCDLVTSDPSDTKQLWSIDSTATAGGVYQIRNMATPTFALDLWGPSSTNDTHVAAVPIFGQNNQKWTFIK